RVLRFAHGGGDAVGGRDGGQREDGAGLRILHLRRQLLGLGEAAGARQGDQQVLVDRLRPEVLLERLVLVDGGAEVGPRGVAQPFGVVLQQDGELGAGG